MTDPSLTIIDGYRFVSFSDTITKHIIFAERVPSNLRLDFRPEFLDFDSEKESMVVC
jgi:hypothetical protein